LTGRTTKGVLRLGGAEYDDVSKSICVDGRITLLDPRAAAVFAQLVERFGERVSKDELLATAWRGRIVEENSIAKAISKLRAALRGSGLAITASYGVGYVLHEVASHPALAELQSDDPTDTTRAPKRRIARFVIGTFAAAILVAAAVLVERTAGIGRVPVRQSPPATNDRPDAIATLLWVDDHPVNNRLEVAAFRQSRLAVHLAESSEDALKLLAMNQYQLVISDLGRGDDRLAGLKMIAEMRRRGFAVPVLIYTLRPKTAAGQAAQRTLVLGGGATDLAVTPEEVRAKVIGRFAPDVAKPAAAASNS